VRRHSGANPAPTSSSAFLCHGSSSGEGTRTKSRKIVSLLYSIRRARWERFFLEVCAKRRKREDTTDWTQGEWSAVNFARTTVFAASATMNGAGVRASDWFNTAERAIPVRAASPARLLLGTKLRPSSGACSYLDDEIGGKAGLAPASRFVLKAGQAGQAKSLAPFADDLARRIEPGSDQIVGEALGCNEDDLGTNDITIR
jgi:hypothetical protein